METKICKNPVCEKETHSKFAGYCQKCSIRGNARRNGYKMDEQELDLGESTGFILRRAVLTGEESEGQLRKCSSNREGRMNKFYKKPKHEYDLNISNLNKRDRKIIEYLKGELVERMLLSKGATSPRFVVGYNLGTLQGLINKMERLRSTHKTGVKDG